MYEEAYVYRKIIFITLLRTPRNFMYYNLGERVGYPFYETEQNIFIMNFYLWMFILAQESRTDRVMWKIYMKQHLILLKSKFFEQKFSVSDELDN